MSADDEKLWPRTFGVKGDKTYLELMKELSDQAVAIGHEQQMEGPEVMSEEQAAYQASEPKVIPGLIEGRNVHFVIPEGGKNAGHHRAAIICRVWDHDTGLCNLTVFWDGTNDGPRDTWVGSIYYSAEPKPNTWHFMERA